MVSSYKVAQAPRSTLGSVSRDTSTMNVGSSATLTNAVSSTLTSPQFGSGIKIKLLMILCLVTRRPPGLDRLPGDPPIKDAKAPWAVLSDKLTVTPFMLPTGFRVTVSPVCQVVVSSGWLPGLRCLVPISLEATSSVWPVRGFLIASLGSRMTQPITSTPTWVPAGMSGALTPGEPMALLPPGKACSFSPATGGVASVAGRRFRLRYYPSHLLPWFEVNLFVNTKSSYVPRGTQKLYDHMRLPPARTVNPMTAPATGLISIIVTTGAPGHNCGNWVEIPIPLHWCRDQDRSVCDDEDPGQPAEIVTKVYNSDSHNG